MTVVEGGKKRQTVSERGSEQFSAWLFVILFKKSLKREASIQFGVYPWVHTLRRKTCQQQCGFLKF